MVGVSWATSSLTLRVMTWKQEVVQGDDDGFDGVSVSIFVLSHWREWS